MKHRIYILLAGISLLLSSCYKDRVTGAGSSITETRNTATFNAVSILGSNNVYITKGNTLSVQVTGYANLMPYFETNVVNKELRLGYRSGTNVRNDNLKVYITMPDGIDFLNVQGSGNLRVTGNFINSSSIDLLVTGSGNIDFDQGTAPKGHLVVAGSGNINAYGLQIKDNNISLNGSGNIQTTATEKLDVTIAGSGNVYYKGTPTSVNTIIAGSGRLIRQ